MPKSKQRIERRLELRRRAKRNPSRKGLSDMLVDFEDSNRDRMTFVDFLSKAFHRIFDRGQRQEYRRQAR